MACNFVLSTMMVSLIKEKKKLIKMAHKSFYQIFFESEFLLASVVEEEEYVIEAHNLTRFRPAICTLCTSIDQHVYVQKRTCTVYLTLGTLACTSTYIVDHSQAK